MWIPTKLVDLFSANADIVRTQQAEIAVLRADRDNLKIQSAITQNTLDWLRIKVNQLELERAGLIEKAYNIKLPAPEIISRPSVQRDMTEFTFDDERDSIALKHGLAAAWDK